MKESEKKQIELPCDIVEDLLPLYHDEVVSEETRQAVARHLTTCEKCLKEYNLLTEELVEPVDSGKKIKEENRIGDFLKRVRKRGVLKGVIVTVIIAAFLAGVGYVLTSVPVMTVPSKNISVEHVFEEKGNYFIVYKAPRYTCPRAIPFHYDKEKKQVSINYKVPVLGFLFDDEKMDVNVITIDQENLEEEGFTPETIFYNGKKIYESKDTANQKAAPDYVKIYLEYHNTEHGFGMHLDENTIELSLSEERDGNEVKTYYRTWDWEGNLLYDSEEEELLSGTFTLNGEKMSAPLTVQSFLDKNWSIETGIEDKIPANSVAKASFKLSRVNADGKNSIYINVRNSTSSEIKPKDAEVYELIIECHEGEENNTLVLPKGITLNSTYDEIIKTYGEATEDYLNDAGFIKYYGLEEVSLTQFSKSIEIQFMEDKQTIEKIILSF